MSSVFCIGSAHLDIYMDTDDIVGIDKRGIFNVSVGGTMYNIACNLQHLGLSVAFGTVLKEDSLFTTLVLQKIKENGLSLKHIELSDKIKQESGFIAYRENKDLKFAINSTPIENIDISYLFDEDADYCFLDLNNSVATVKNILATQKPVVISCVSESKVLKLNKIFADRELTRNIKVIFMNRFELASFLQSTKYRNAFELSQDFKNILFVVTKDARGVDIWQAGDLQMFPPVNIQSTEAVNFSGAGDAFASAFFYNHVLFGRDIVTSVNLSTQFTKEVILSKSANIKINNYLGDFDRLIFTDQLTGLYNRTYLYRWLDVNKSRKCTVLMFDIDHFKKINDTYGHDVGDIALKEFAKILSKNIRQKDLLVRFGGEEFVAILKDADKGLSIAERIRKDIEGNVIILDGGTNLKFTVSIGVARTDSLTKETFSQILKQADNALYQAKTTGRNKIVFAGIDGG